MDPLQQEIQDLKADLKQQLCEDLRILRELRHCPDAWAAFSRPSPPTLQKHLQAHQRNVGGTKLRNNDSWSTSSLYGRSQRGTSALPDMSTEEMVEFIHSHLE